MDKALKAMWGERGGLQTSFLSKHSPIIIADFLEDSDFC